MKRFFLSLLFVFWIPLYAQTTPPKPLVQSRGTLAEIPVGCELGQLYFATDQTAGSNIYGCDTGGNPGHWSPQGGGGSSLPWGIFTQSFQGSGATINGGATRYSFMGSSGFDLEADPTFQLMYFTEDRTFRKLCVAIYQHSPTGGTVVGTVLKNGSPTAIVLTIPANSQASGNPYCDLVHTAAFSSGDTGQIQWTNNDGGNPMIFLNQSIQVQDAN